MTWLNAMLLVLLALGIAIAAALVYGKIHWQTEATKLHARLAAAQLPAQTKVFALSELESLPVPVQRYFLAVLKDGQPIVAAVSVNHQGMFNMSDASEQWKPFTSTQRVVTHRPGFDWDARIMMLPGVAVHVHDAYIAGHGILQAAVLGLFTVADRRGSGEVARGELMRFFMEAAWYPTALLPSQGVRWLSVDDRSARATLRDAGITLTLLFRFREDGLIDTVLADARGRLIGNQVTSTPWQGKFSNYAVRDGMRVPLDGEVAWILPEGIQTYWRGTISSIAYEFAGGF